MKKAVFHVDGAPPAEDDISSMAGGSCSVSSRAVFHLNEEGEEPIGAVPLRRIPRPRSLVAASFTKLMKTHANLLVPHVLAISRGGLGVETKKALEKQANTWRAPFLKAYNNPKAFDKFRLDLLEHIRLLDGYVRKTLKFYKTPAKERKFTWQRESIAWLTNETRELREGRNLGDISRLLTKMVSQGGKFKIDPASGAMLDQSGTIRDAWSFHGLCTARYATILITKTTELFEEAKTNCLNQAKKVGSTLDFLIRNRGNATIGQGIAYEEEEEELPSGAPLLRELQDAQVQLTYAKRRLKIKESLLKSVRAEIARLSKEEGNEERERKIRKEKRAVKRLAKERKKVEELEDTVSELHWEYSGSRQPKSS